MNHIDTFHIAIDAILVTVRQRQHLIAIDIALTL